MSLQRDQRDTVQPYLYKETSGIQYSHVSTKRPAGYSTAISLQRDQQDTVQPCLYDECFRPAGYCTAMSLQTSVLDQQDTVQATFYAHNSPPVSVVEHYMGLQGYTVRYRLTSHTLGHFIILEFNICSCQLCVHACVCACVCVSICA